MVKKFVKKGRKRGLSPIVTTVLLIALTIAITAIVFLWFRGMVEDSVTKFSPPKNIKLVCEEVNFDVSYSSGTLNIVNNGDVSIFRVNIKTSQDGNYQTKDITDFAGSTWPSTGLAQGGTFSGNIGSEVGSSGKITVLPVLIGTSSKGKKTFVCEGQYGKEVTL